MGMRRPLVLVKILLPPPHPLRLHPPPHPLRLHPPLLQTMGGPPLHPAHSRQQLNKTVTTQEKNSTTRESTRVLSIVVNLSPTFPFTHRPSMPLQNYLDQHPPQAAAVHPRTWIIRPSELFTSPSSSLHFCLDNPPAHSTLVAPAKHGLAHTNLIVADTGATDHVPPDKNAFISYRPVTRRRVRMGNTSFAPILGSGSAVIDINGK